MKKLFTLVVIAMLYSCDGLEYSGNTKIVFEGHINDQNGEPLRDLLISTHIKRDGISGGFLFPGSNGDYDLISYTKTDRNGYYRMIFPKPTNQDNIALGINTETSDADANPEYSNIYVTNIQDSDINDYTINFGERRLFRQENTTMLTVILTNATWGSGVIPYGLLNHNLDVYNTPVHQLYSPQETSDSTITYSFEVARNQQLTLRYFRWIEGGNFDEITIPIGNEPVTQTINL